MSTPKRWALVILYWVLAFGAVGLLDWVRTH